MFVDEVDIHVAAGHGGAGALSFRREKFVPRGGPDGGDGGHGGSIYIVASANLNTLLNFRFQKTFEADRGAHGEGSNRTGKSGADIVLEVPIGTSSTSGRAEECETVSARRPDHARRRASSSRRAAAAAGATRSSPPRRIARRATFSRGCRAKRRTCGCT